MKLVQHSTYGLSGVSWKHADWQFQRCKHFSTILGHAQCQLVANRYDGTLHRGHSTMKVEKKMYQLSPLNTSPSSQCSLTIPCNVSIIHPTLTWWLACLGGDFIYKLMLIHTHTHIHNSATVERFWICIRRTRTNTWNETKYFVSSLFKFYWWSLVPMNNETGNCDGMKQSEILSCHTKMECFA